MFEVPAASLTTELYCLHTATSASNQPSVFHSSRLMKSFHRSDFPVVFWRHGVLDFTCVGHIHEKKFFYFKELQHIPMSFLEVIEYTGINNYTSIQYTTSFTKLYCWVVVSKLFWPVKLTCRNQGKKTGSEAGSGSGDENGKRTSTLLLFFPLDGYPLVFLAVLDSLQ